ncbi:DVU_1555 family C-GCAxxG-C-C protein [Telmatospirillum sp.]|uniref:DVU_1555 family C-GCAxxG-C-C protein n=1 Tax=Telmatospirillum sp. TaxID=2079197 RepID=UPI00283E9F62|nr:DV_1555 family C-GCAxxG-C-C protein [Telmatospirillum sp.]MDR3439969.1 C-GCAxxG-C-C family protein [Telmatospirillum sp.]
MANEEFRVLELSLQGFNCSQILAIMALEAQGKEDPLLVRAMSGLLGGFGCGKTCGTLTGGCCMLGLYAGRGDTEEQEGDDLPLMLAELVEWFEAEFGMRYGGIDCDDITEKDPGLRLSRCPQMVIDTFKKITEILDSHDYSIDGLSRSRQE